MLNTKLKKAEMTTGMLIGLVLLIIVLAISIWLIAKNVGFFTANSDCKAQGGICVDAANCRTSRIYGAACSDIEICCLKGG